MNAGAPLFAQQLRELGIVPTVDGDWVVFDYLVASGSFQGQEVRIAILVPANFPDVPPGGINFSPRLRPVNTNAQHPQRSHKTKYGAFGDDGEYWSRPYPNWASEPHKNAHVYMGYVAKLWETT